MSAPVVSVLLPYRDAEATLLEAIAGVLDERVPLELLAIDDGSRDGGPAIVAELAAKDARVVPLAAHGVGIALALDVGARASRAAFVARMDADDVSIAPRIARSIELLDADPRLGVVGARVEAFPTAAVEEGLRRYVAWMNALVTPEEHARDLFVESPLCHPSTTMRRAALEAAGGYRDVPWPEDYDLWLRVAAAGYGLAKLPELGLRWRHHARRATLTDARYELAAFAPLKARYLAPRLVAAGRPVAVWGAGKTGKHLARALEPEGVTASRFVDIDPRKIGGVARGAPIVAPEGLVRGTETIVVAVGARGARDLVRAWLTRRGFVEGADFVCAA